MLFWFSQEYTLTLSNTSSWDIFKELLKGIVISRFKQGNARLKGLEMKTKRQGVYDDITECDDMIKCPFSGL